jgi:hypothetical protein
VSAPAAAAPRCRAAAPARLHLFHVGPGEGHARELGVGREVCKPRLDQLANVARRRGEEDAEPRAALCEGEELRRAGDGEPLGHGRGGEALCARAPRPKVRLAVTVDDAFFHLPA